MQSLSLEQDATPERQEKVVSTNELDVLMQQIVEARAVYEKAKEHASALCKIRDDLQYKMIAKLKEAGKTQWKIDGLGTASIVETMSVQVPKTDEDKRKLWNYIVQKYGETVAFDKFSMHSKTLISFYNEELKIAEDASLFELPGVEAPTANSEFRFRKA